MRTTLGYVETILAKNIDHPMKEPSRFRFNPGLKVGPILVPDDVKRR